MNLLNLRPGNYGVTVTDANGCTASNEVEIVEMAEILVDFNIDHPTSNLDSDGRIEVANIVGNLPVSVYWENGSVELVRDSLSPGDYIVTIMDALGCSRVVTVQLTPKSIISALDVRVWPSPVSNHDLLNIEIASPSSVDLILRIGDVVGQLVSEYNLSVQSGTQLFQCDLDLPSATYVLYFFQDDILLEALPLMVLDE